MRKYLALSAAALAISLMGLGLKPAQAAGVREGMCLTSEEVQQEIEQRQSESSATSECSWFICAHNCEIQQPPCQAGCTPICESGGLCSPIGCVFAGCGWQT